MTPSDRKALERDVYEVLTDLDGTGQSALRMKELFGKMSDKQFVLYFKKFFDDPDAAFRVTIPPMKYDKTFDDICKVGEKYGIPIFEYVAYPNLSEDPNNPMISNHPIMVVDVKGKRLAQMLFKKNSASTSITHRNPKTDQVIDHDKNARFTDVESYSLIVMEQYNAAREFYGPRADDQRGQADMLKEIASTGTFHLDNLSNDMLDKATPNTINYMMLGCCIETNIISDNGNILPATMRSRENKEVTVDRTSL